MGLYVCMKCGVRAGRALLCPQCELTRETPLTGLESVDEDQQFMDEVRSDRPNSVWGAEERDPRPVDFNPFVVRADEFRIVAPDETRDELVSGGDGTPISGDRVTSILVGDRITGYTLSTAPRSVSLELGTEDVRVLLASVDGMIMTQCEEIACGLDKLTDDWSGDRRTTILQELGRLADLRARLRAGGMTIHKEGEVE